MTRYAQYVTSADGNVYVLRPRSEWKPVAEQTYTVDKKTGRVIQVPTGRVTYDPNTMYRPATYQDKTAMNTQRVRASARPPSNRLALPTRRLGRSFTRSDRGYYLTAAPGDSLYGARPGDVVNKTPTQSNSFLGRPSSPTDYWGVGGNPTPQHFSQDPNDPMSKLGGGWFVRNDSGTWTRLANYSPELSSRMNRDLSYQRDVGDSSSSGSTGGGYGVSLTPEEAARIEEAIMNIGSGSGADWMRRAGELALEAAENPGMTDAERKATLRRLNREEIIPGYASEREQVALAGGPGVRQRLSELRLGETGARLELASDLAEEQLHSQREGRLQAINTLGTTSELDRARSNDIISSLLRYGTTPGHGGATGALPLRSQSIGTSRGFSQSLRPKRVSARRTTLRLGGNRPQQGTLTARGSRSRIAPRSGGQRIPSLLTR